MGCPPPLRPHPVLLSLSLQIEKFGDPNGVVQFTEDALRERVYNEATDRPFNISLYITRREGVVGNITVRFHSLVKLIPLNQRSPTRPSRRRSLSIAKIK